VPGEPRSRRSEQQIAEITEGSSEALHEKIGRADGRQRRRTGDAVSLLAAMPELGRLDGKQAASLAGLAPFPRDSGKRKGYRRTRAAASTCATPFHASLSAARYNKDLKIFYDRLIKNGKRKAPALIAVARKLLVILNAKLRDAALKPA